jgi:hypothetical protein
VPQVSRLDIDANGIVSVTARTWRPARAKITISGSAACPDDVVGW